MSFKCLICEKEFTRQTSLEYHSNKVVCLKEKKTYECLICNKIFDHHSTFQKHTESKSCNYDTIKKFKEEINNLQIKLSTSQLALSSLQNNFDSLTSDHSLLTSKYKKIETILNNEKDSNDSLVDAFENATLEKLTITEDLLFNNNKLTFKLFSLIRQIILNHHNNKYFDIIKKIIFKLKTFNNIHKDINEHFHIIFNNPETQKDDLKTTFKYFKPLLKDTKYFDNYFKINFKIDSDNFDFSSV
jgi:DNA-directed RNA polymerase subunit RPC12/RpoP